MSYTLFCILQHIMLFTREEHVLHHIKPTYITKAIIGRSNHLLYIKE